jgi:hypothetical protein
LTLRAGIVPYADYPRGVCNALEIWLTQELCDDDNTAFCLTLRQGDHIAFSLFAKDSVPCAHQTCSARAGSSTPAIRMPVLKLIAWVLQTTGSM